jgi:glycosyltransferase involved in cell wall biosynthesis
VRPLPGRFGGRVLVATGWSGAVRQAIAGADLAHVHLGRDYLTRSATRTIAGAGVPIVLQTHGKLSPPVPMGLAIVDRLLTRPALRRAGHFITHTDTEKPALRGFGVPADRLSTIASAVPDPPVRWSPGPQRKPRRLLFVSRLHPRKQVLMFAEMVARLHRQGHTVEGIIAGPDQGDLPQLLEFIRRDDHPTFLTYLGELDRRQLTAQLVNATAFVFPARAEPFGLVLLEALAVGTPVVSTSETPLAAILSAAEAALISAPGLGPLTTAVGRLLADPPLQNSLSRNGRGLYEAEWTTAAMVGQLLALYKEAAVLSRST